MDSSVNERGESGAQGEERHDDVSSSVLAMEQPALRWKGRVQIAAVCSPSRWARVVLARPCCWRCVPVQLAHALLLLCWRIEQHTERDSKAHMQCSAARSSASCPSRVTRIQLVAVQCSLACCASPCRWFDDGGGSRKGACSGEHAQLRTTALHATRAAASQCESAQRHWRRTRGTKRGTARTTRQHRGGEQGTHRERVGIAAAVQMASLQRASLVPAGAQSASCVVCWCVLCAVRVVLCRPRALFPLPSTDRRSGEERRDLKAFAAAASRSEGGRCGGGGEGGRGRSPSTTVHAQWSVGAHTTVLFLCLVSVIRCPSCDDFKPNR